MSMFDGDNELNLSMGEFMDPDALDELLRSVDPYTQPANDSPLSLLSTEADAPSRKRARGDFEAQLSSNASENSFSTNAPQLSHEMPAIPPSTSSLLHESPYMLPSQSPGMDFLRRMGDDVPFSPSVVETDLPSTQQPSTETLSQIQNQINILQKSLQMIVAAQRDAPVPIEEADYLSLDADQCDAMQEAIRCERELQSMLSTLFLSPPLLAQVLEMIQDVTLVRKKLDLCHEELLYYRNPTTAPRCFIALVITKQPFPKPIKQNTKATGTKEDPVEVELICAPKANYSQAGQVTGKIIKPGRGENKKLEIIGAEATMGSDGVARFTDIRFPQGTRKSQVQVQFSMTVTYIQPNGSPAEHTLESDLTQPIIVITNENQWKDAEQTLLTATAFAGSSAISWPRFFNFLQIHYLRSTRQSLENPERGLSLREYEYIRKLSMFNRSGAASNVSLNDFERFWKWFGDAMHRIRHNRIFNNMWMQGAIYGFVDKHRSNQILQRQPPNSVLLRFSERCPGHIAVAYSSRDNISGRITMAHVLLPPSETAENKNLAEVISSRFQFSQVPLVATDFNSQTSESIRGLITRRDLQRRHCAPEGEPFVPPTGYQTSTDGPYFDSEQ